MPECVMANAAGCCSWPQTPSKRSRERAKGLSTGTGCAWMGMGLLGGRYESQHPIRTAGEAPCHLPVHEFPLDLMRITVVKRDPHPGHFAHFGCIRLTAVRERVLCGDPVVR